MAETDAYVGYRSAGRRPESQQDRRASADMPLQAARGWVAGTLGLPGDIEGLARMLVKYGAAPGSVVDRKMSETPALPTTEFYKEWLPLRSEAPAAKLAGDLGSLFGGVGSTRVARAALDMPLSPLRAAVELPRNIARAGREFLQAGVPAHVVKPKGGNWLAGSVEDALKPLKRSDLPMPTTEDLAGIADDPRVLAEIRRRQVEPAINQWLDQKLARYIKNEMGTPEDPLRALIQERGVSHTPLETLQEGAWVPEEVADYRRAAGFPEEGMAVMRHAEAGYPEGRAADLARAAEGWESTSDTAIVPDAAGELSRIKALVEQNPWLAKVPPETPVYSLDKPNSVSLEFGHIVDELRNALNPNSGLPRHLQLTPEQLGRVSTPQAVELVSKINEYRAAEKVAADLARAQNAAVHTFKEYPEKGFKWVELKAPESVDPAAFAGDPRIKLSLGDTIESRGPRLALEDALKYEGDVMGHCVGGYCPDVLEGRSRIFSLRSAKGEPHVTVEVRPGKDKTGLITAEQLAAEAPEVLESMKRRNVYDPQFMYRYDEQMGRYLPEMGPFEPSIVQIKGKVNRAPKEEYLPYVQDFVRSQKWGHVGDLQNTGLRRLSDAFNENELAKMREAGVDVSGDYFTPEQINGMGNRVWPGMYGDAKNFAAGGLVTYNPARVDELANSLREELNAYQ